MIRRSTLGFAIELLRRHPRRSAIVFACYVVASMAEGLGLAAGLPLIGLALKPGGAGGEPSMLERVATSVLGAVGLAPSVESLLALLVVGLTLKALLVFFANREAGLAGADVAATMRLSLIKALLRARWRVFTRQPVGELGNAMGIETDNTANAYSATCQAGSMAIQTLFYFVAAVLVSWKVTVAALLCGALLLLLFARFVGSVRRAGDRWATSMATLSRKLVDGFAGFKALKAMSREDGLFARLAHEVEAIRSAVRHYTTILQLRSAIEEPLLAIALALGIYLYITYEPIAPEALILLAGLFYRSVSRLTMLQKHYGGVAQLETFYRQLIGKIRAAESDAEPPGGVPPPAQPALIRLVDVSFAYDRASVISGVNLAIAPRQITVLIGPSGAGKSTIVDLVLGLADPAAGRVEIGGAAMTSLDRRVWRRGLGYVPQDVVLFNESILFNIALDEPGIERDDVRAALEEADLWAFVNGLPEGLDTPIGERGALLSGGQRQRLAIARALAHRPALLVLDEATSALDPETEAAIWATLRRVARSRTILAVTHQTRALGFADAIYEVRDGSVEPVELRKAGAS